MLTWRPYKVTDWPQVKALREEQEKKLGKELDTPNLVNHPVLITEVAVDQKGKIHGAFFFESYPSLAMIGRSGKAMAAAAQYAPKVLQRFRECGFRIVQVEIPKGVPAQERKAMIKEAQRIGKRSGFPFKRIPKSHGFFDLRGA